MPAKSVVIPPEVAEYVLKATPAELKALKHLMDHARNQVSAMPDDSPYADRNDHLLYRTLTKFLHEKHLRFPPLSNAPQRILHIVAESLEKALQSGFKNSPVPYSTVYLLQFFRLYAEITYSALKKFSIPVTLKTMLNNQNLFFMALEEQFPKYIESGAVWIALQQMNGPSDKNEEIDAYR